MIEKIDLAEDIKLLRPKQRQFLAALRIVDSSNHACDLVGTSRSNPAHWRRNSAVFRRVEKALFDDPIGTLEQLSFNNLFLAGLTQEKLMMDKETPDGIRRETARDAQNFAVKMKELNIRKSQKPLEIRMKHDTGSGIPIQPASDTGDSSPVEGEEEDT